MYQEELIIQCYTHYFKKSGILGDSGPFALVVKFLYFALVSISKNSSTFVFFNSISYKLITFLFLSIFFSVLESKQN
jgi:hypothetical protein